MSYYSQYTRHSPQYPLPGYSDSSVPPFIQRANYLSSTGGQVEEHHYEVAPNPQPRNITTTTTTASMQSSPIPTSALVPQVRTQLRTTTTKPTAAAAEGHTIFSQNQLNALKYQITAYKLLHKNAPLPSHLYHAVLAPFDSLSVIDSPSAPIIVKSSTTTSKKPVKPHATSTKQQQQQRPVINNTTSLYNAYIPPRQLLPKKITSYQHASRQQRLLVPSLTPTGLDPRSILSQRNKRVLDRIQQKIDSFDNINDENKNIKDIIHVKSLKLLQKQQKMRYELIDGLSRSTVLATSADRTAYRRMKKISLKDTRAVEAMENEQRGMREQALLQAKQTRLNNIIDHGVSLIAHHNNVRNIRSMLGKTVLQYHRHVEKSEQRKLDRIAKERIIALKNNDEEAYMKLIDEAKDTRLTQLLKQTGQFLDTLTNYVVEQQNDMISMGPRDRTEETIRAKSGKATNSSDDYYNITHQIKETVCQPNILVGGTLKDYQLKGLQWMVSLYNNNLNGILADEMGLGKTIQTISLITYMIEMKRQNGPYLIIVPLSTLTNWTMEFEKWAPSVSKIVYKGNPAARRNLAGFIRPGGFQVLLTTFEFIIRDRAVLSRIKWLYIIMDEGHRMKNTNSKLTVALRTSYKSQCRLILTGTPLQNNLPELWALLNFILPRIFKSVKSFEEWFNTPFSNQGVQDRIELNEEEQLLIIKRLHKVLRPFLLRRLKKDVEADLPDKVEHVIKCKLSALQLKLYQQIKKNNNVFVNSDTTGQVTMRSLSNTIMHLRKVCNHPFVFEGVEPTLNPSGKSNELLYRSSGKFELLDRMLPKLRMTGHRVLIFFQMTRIMSIMEDYLNWRKYPYLRLDGSTKPEDRSSLLKKFNQPNSPYFIFLLSTRAGGLGLNLQTADTVIIFDSDWNPHQDLQAQDRAHRIGQTKEVRIYRLITSNSIEENILARANYKLDVDGKVIQAGKFDNRSTEKDREAFLRSLLEDKLGEDDMEEDEEDIDEDEELNEMLQRSERELSIFRHMDDERETYETEIYRRRGYSKPLERLIQEDELPEVFTREDEPITDPLSQLIDAGRGRRVRDEVCYDDGLTEEQWLEALEKDEIQAEIELNKSRERVGSQDDEPMRSKKRNKSHDVLPPELRQQLTQVFIACYNAVENATVMEEPDEDGDDDEPYERQRCELFMDLVSKKEYPIYYDLITHPISMNMIKKRIHSAYYDTVLQFEQDFQLMFDNARTFNEEGSSVYEDADEMQKIFDAELEKQCPGGLLPRISAMPNKHDKSTYPNRKKKTPHQRTRRKSVQEHEDDDYVDDDE